MRITVSTGYSYEAPDDVRLGDEVRIPAARGWGDLFPEQWVKVTRLGTNYTGHCVSVLEVRPAEEGEAT